MNRVAACASRRARGNLAPMEALRLFDLEARSARLSAHLDANPEVETIWHRLVSLEEAGASLSMEDIPAALPDIVLGGHDTGLNLGDPQAARIARGIDAFLQRPGDILDDPAELVDRALFAGRLSSLTELDHGGRAAYIRPEADPDWRDARRDIVEATRLLTREGSVIQKLVAFSSLVSQFLPEPVPIAERLIFVAAESALRAREARRFGLGEPRQSGLAHWTLSPAIALSRGGFRAWSPASDAGAKLLVERLDKSLARNIGYLARIAKWRQGAATFAGKTRKSHRGDLAILIGRNPILSSQIVADRLSITERAARGLIADAVDAGLLSLITPRRAYRLWAHPALAEQMRAQPAPGRAPRRHEPQQLSKADNMERITTRSREESDAAIAAAEAGLDEALNAADTILERHRKRMATRQAKLTALDDDL